MQLLGSSTSPYVRRIRALCMQYGLECQLDSLDIFSPEGREQLKEKNPVLKVPALVDDEQTIYDSRVIARYIMNKAGIRAFSWSQENLLTLIDAANDSLVTQLISIRSGIDINADNMFYGIQRERIADIYQVLDQEVLNGAFDRSHYPTICLYCLLDWAEFRELKTYREYPGLSAFVAKYQSSQFFIDTNPRN
ncbi:glutathione S-transferase family protein [Thalassotalea montiporae]